MGSWGNRQGREFLTVFIGSGSKRWDIIFVFVYIITLLSTSPTAASHEEKNVEMVSKR
jgi:hypothetical protein